MIFGEKNLFAFEVHPEEGKTHLFCEAFFWFDGFRVGDPELIGVSGALLLSIESFCKDQQARVDHEIFSLDKEEAHSLVSNSCHMNSHEADQLSDEDLGHLETLATRFGPMCLSPSFFETLEDYRVVVVSDGTTQRILWNERGTEVVREKRMPEGSLEKLLSDTAAFVAQAQLIS